MMELAGATDLSMGSSPRQTPGHAGHSYRTIDSEMAHEQKTRLPNWTEEEKNVLIQEVRRRAAVLTTPRAKGMSHLKEKAWEEITAAVNAVQAPGSQLRNAQTCRKKWENLKLYAKKAQKEGRNDLTLATVSQLIGSDVDLKVLQATLQAVQGASSSPSPSPGPIDAAGPEQLGAIFTVLQQQGMNGALARMLGLSGPLPNAAASDEASLSDCSNSVEDPDELRAALRVKAELGDEARRLSGGSGGSGSGITLSGAERINGHHTIGGLDHLLQAVQQQQQQQQLQLEHVKQSPSPLPLPPGVSLEPVQKMTISQTPPSAASLARRTPTPSGSHLSQHLHHSSQSSQSSQNAVTLNGFHLPQQQHQQQQIHHRETHTPSNHPHPQQQRLHRSTLAHGGQLYANGGARQRSSTSELSVSGQMNTRTTVNGVSTKRRRDFDSEPNDSSENLVEKRTFYKEMTKLCGTVQNLVESMRETHHLKQRVLLEKLRLVRMREAALVAQAQRDSLVEKEAASRILPENSNDAPQENLKAIDDIGEEEDHHGDELIEESTARSKDGSQEDSASSKDIEPSSAERQLLPDIEEKMDDFDEDLSRDEGKGKDEGLGIGIMLDEDDENDLDTSKRVTKEEAPETEEE